MLYIYGANKTLAKMPTTTDSNTNTQTPKHPNNILIAKIKNSIVR